MTSRILDNPLGPPFLVAERIEDPALVTVLIYGHGDTVRGLDDLWRPGLSPWTLTVEGDRCYGRGTADNKGQHTINIAALAAVLAEREQRGSGLGFNVKVLIEMGEEIGSRGLASFAFGTGTGCWRPTCWSPPTARALLPVNRPSFWARAAATRST